MDEDVIESDENDDDYVPSEEESDDAVGSEDKLAKTNRKQKIKGKRKRNQAKSKRTSRKRKVGVWLEEEEEKEIDFSESDGGDDDDDDDDDKTAETPDTNESTEKPQEDEKKKADSLWADFLKDVDPPPKSKNMPTSKPQTQMKDPPVNPVSSKKTTITQVFDFAGESVSVMKEVDADSEEAKQHADNKDGEKTKEEDDKANSGGLKRAGSVGNVLGQLMGKKAKLSTLEKSRLDWETFKKAEKIDEELRLHNKGKDGYLEKQAFLQRVDVRQFELEKDIRAINRSKR